MEKNLQVAQIRLCHLKYHQVWNFLLAETSAYMVAVFRFNISWLKNNMLQSWRKPMGKAESDTKQKKIY